MRRVSWLLLCLLVLAWGLAGRVPTASAQHAPEAAAAAPHGDSAEAEEIDILKVDLPLAFWTLIVFLLLLFVLGRFAWGPLSKALDNREVNLRRTVEQTEHARAESERLLAEHHRLMEQAQQQVQALLDEARRDAATTSEGIKQTAQAEADATIQRARREIATARDQALLDLWNRTADLAVSVAGKVLSREIRPEDHRHLVQEAIAELPAASEKAGA